MTYRLIHTDLWDDDWVLRLSPPEKLVWIYLFSNSRTHMIGLYELSIRKAAFETGLPEEQIAEMLGRFEADGKLRVAGTWIWIKAMLVRNVNNLQSQKVRKGLERAIQEVSDSCPFKEDWIRYYDDVIAVQYELPPLGSGQTPRPDSRAEPGPEDGEAATNTAIDAWLSVRAGAVNSLDAKRILDLCDEAEEHRSGLPKGAPGSALTGMAWVEEAILEANASRRDDRTISLNFVQAILDRWYQQGFKAPFGKKNGASEETTTADGRRLIKVGA